MVRPRLDASHQLFGLSASVDRVRSYRRYQLVLPRQTAWTTAPRASQARDSPERKGAAESRKHFRGALSASCLVPRRCADLVSNLAALLAAHLVAYSAAFSAASLAGYQISYKTVDLTVCHMAVSICCHGIPRGYQLDT